MPVEIGGVSPPRKSYIISYYIIAVPLKNAYTQKPEITEINDTDNRAMTMAETQLNILIVALNQIHAEGFLNECLFEENDLERIKEEIKSNL